MYPIDLSQSAENHCGRIMRACADWETFSVFILRLNLPSLQDTQPLDTRTSTHALSYISRMVAECEFYTFERLKLVVKNHVEKIDNQMLSQLYKKNATNLDSTWPKALDSYKEWMGENLRDLTSWKNLRMLIEVRNASAHGGGAWTVRQLNDINMMKSAAEILPSMGYAIVGNEILVSSKSIRASAYVCRSFIMELDAHTNRRC